MNIQSVSQNQQQSFGIKLTWKGTEGEIKRAKAICEEFIRGCSTVRDEYKILVESLDFAERSPSNVTAEYFNNGVLFTSEKGQETFIKQGSISLKQMAINLKNFFANLQQPLLSTDILSEQLIHRFEALS
jgi:hypothetical protein